MSIDTIHNHENPKGSHSAATTSHHSLDRERDSGPSFQFPRTLSSNLSERGNGVNQGVGSDGVFDEKMTNGRESLKGEEGNKRDEKLMYDLENVTSAIERLYAAAPQLDNQRVEMRAGPSTERITENGEKARERMERDKWRELEEIWKMIEHAHRRVRDGRDGQRVDREGLRERREDRVQIALSFQSGLSDLRIHAHQQRQKFFDDLVDNGENGRFVEQDCERHSVDATEARARESRNRDEFIQQLVDAAQDRLPSQDADAPGSSVELRQRRLEAFTHDIIERVSASRYNSQDYPTTPEARMQAQREQLVDDIIRYSSSGRLVDQRSLPPTPRADKADPMEVVSVKDFLLTKPSSSKLSERRKSVGGETGGRSRSNSSEEGRNGFAKFKSIVRRSSLSLGLISNPLEHQENLNIVQIMLHGPHLSSVTDLVVQVPPPLPNLAHITNSSQETGVTEALIVSKRDPASSFRISLPVAVRQDQTVPLIPQSLHLEAKLASLPIRPEPSAFSLHSALSHPMSGSELRSFKPHTLACASCQCDLADLSDITLEGYKDLPSEHWAEMLDVWMCHQDPSWTSQLAEKTNDGFWPTLKTVLVGGSYLLVHRDHVDLKILTAEKSSAEQGWFSLNCTCGAVLGKQREKDGRPGEGTVRFDKWALPLQHPLSAYIISDMLALAQAHASYRFIISDPIGPRMKIWLFNPSVRISYRRATSNNSPSPSPFRATFTPSRRSSNTSLVHSKSTDMNGDHLRPKGHSTSSNVKGGTRILRAAKIMYRILPSSSDEELPGFGEMNQVESLVYPTSVCEVLERILRESTGMYPLARRTMGAFDVGFLERV
ncbi:hypothetical protein TREMEDRAFT_62784 [Tremella mesenterica DSM 1558]|uniref:uncharacterized protein n=1 Tax=Tremella mesenterica (strain ATCC 24925 / CBS 8224 / DSM 1558 / NBRC 9311 / NRRL Y-6157 / RJB 2259-6 / UBC 559-6) TaxID=578456 RepID=UPI0003F49E40|nr:uncharacterized protein TREMEDRAFT_62784 [Tremella mesenterica DSM 1558]EIW69056.1 hypothetical protein TREMEDRAFT_62784 [Tremella mesenterica DSM 1558]